MSSKLSDVECTRKFVGELMSFDQEKQFYSFMIMCPIELWWIGGRQWDVHGACAAHVPMLVCVGVSRPLPLTWEVCGSMGSGGRETKVMNTESVTFQWCSVTEPSRGFIIQYTPASQPAIYMRWAVLHMYSTWFAKWLLEVFILCTPSHNGHMSNIVFVVVERFTTKRCIWWNHSGKCG